jgi:anti-sigma B factor antagonist
MPSSTLRPCLEVERIGEVFVVKFTPQRILDEDLIQAIGRQLFGLMEKVDRPQLVLNFSPVSQLSGALLAKLVRACQRAKAAGGRLVLCAIDPELYEVFRITRLDKIVSIYRDEVEALQTFEQAQP